MKKVAKAVFVLSFFTLIERILGFFFKVFLSRQLGAAALGVYQVAFSFFIVLLTLTTSGIPLIVSKLTAKYRAKNDLSAESSVSSAALIVSTAVSLCVCLAVLALNKPLGKLFADDRSRAALLLMLPAILFSAAYASLRGNLWGRQKYTAVSLLELSEQIARISLCIILFAVGMNKLSAAALSLSAGCFISAGICVITYFASGSRLKNPKGHIKPLLKSSAPVTASRAATSFVGSMTAIVVPFLLMRGGLSNTEAMYEFGYSVGMGLPLMYIPLTIVGSLAFVMVPALSQAVAEKNNAAVKRQLEGSIKISCVLGAIFVPFFYAFGEPLGAFVYGNNDAGAFLKAASWILIPISIESITSSMMNSLDMELRGFIHYLIGSAVMFTAYFISGKHFSITIMIIGMGASWIIASALNIAAMRKKSKISFSFLITLLIASLTGVPTMFLCRWLYELMGSLGAIAAMLIAGGVGLFFVITLNFLFGTLRMDHFFSKRHKTVAKKL